MKKKILILIFIALFVSCYAQENPVLDDRPECVPFSYITIANGKLPQYTSTILKFQTDCITDSVVCDFRYGQMIRCSHSKTELCDMIPDTSLVYIEYHFKEPVNRKNYKSHTYKDTLLWSTFKQVEVVCINDLNNKKKTYYIYYKLQPPWYRYVIYRKSSRVSKCRFGHKVFRGLYPTRYTETGPVF